MNRAEEREPQSARPEHDRPEPLCSKAEELVREGRCRGRDDEELEDRPADSLQDVDPGRQQRAALAERRAHERHSRDASVRADHPRDREHRVAEDAAEEDRDARLGERECRHEHGARHDHQERHAEIPPQEPGLEPAEDSEPRRDGVDAPAALDRLPIGHQADEAR
jgi:hypothetical protein